MVPTGGKVDSSTHYMVEQGVTELVVEQEWEEELLTVRLEGQEELGVPPPVVVLRAEDKPSGGVVLLLHGQEER